MFGRGASMIFGTALTMCGLLDFVTTIYLCVIVVGMSCAPRILAEPDYLSTLFG
jgi:hypothetical protein